MYCELMTVIMSHIRKKNMKEWPWCKECNFTVSLQSHFNFLHVFLLKSSAFSFFCIRIPLCQNVYLVGFILSPFFLLYVCLTRHRGGLIIKIQTQTDVA